MKKLNILKLLVLIGLMAPSMPMHAMKTNEKESKEIAITIPDALNMSSIKKNMLRRSMGFFLGDKWGGRIYDYGPIAALAVGLGSLTGIVPTGIILGGRVDKVFKLGTALGITFMFCDLKRANNQLLENQEKLLSGQKNLSIGQKNLSIGQRNLSIGQRNMMESLTGINANVSLVTSKVKKNGKEIALNGKKIDLLAKKTNTDLSILKSGQRNIYSGIKTIIDNQKKTDRNIGLIKDVQSKFFQTSHPGHFAKFKRELSFKGK